MYDELVKSIHCCFGFDSMQTDCENCMMKDKREEHNYVGCCDALGLAAADAIEELSKAVDDTNEANIALYGALPKWIPVTERLPQEDGFYLCLYKHKHPGGVAMDEGLSIQQWYNGRWNLNEIYAVTHWMPLPEPPKE